MLIQNDLNVGLRPVRCWDVDQGVGLMHITVINTIKTKRRVTMDKN
jgi:hypothetical protein